MDSATIPAPPVDRPLGAGPHGSGIPLIALVLSGALRLHVPGREGPADPPGD
jgi:hypothetical protein